MQSLCILYSRHSIDTTLHLPKSEATLMIHTSLDMTSIYLLKKQLCDAIIDNNYDLQATEVLTLSEQLDNLMIPLFKEQLDCNKCM